MFLVVVSSCKGDCFLGLTDRNYLIMKELDRWKCCGSRHIKSLVRFKGQRATDRRLKLLIETDWSEEHYKLNAERYLQRLIMLLNKND